jgi:exosortase/archaeosortase family protein
MMPISAEDIGVCVVLFGSYRLRVVGISALLAGFILAAMNSIRITGLSVSDSDPSTYIIVVMLMLLVAIVLSVKYAPDPELKKSNVAIGLSLLAIYVLAISYARGAMSFLFISYRIDALLFPIILASLIILIFGIKGLKRMKFLVIYSIFASPLLLLPTFQISSPFTAFNAYVVFDTLKAIGIPVLKSNLTIIAPSSAQISIAQTCADIGAFIALIMFLLPIAYFYSGKITSKIKWIVSGVALMLLLNVLRMFSIAIVWAYYGIGAAVGTIHVFIGEVLFDIAIVVMILISGRYGLRIRVGTGKHSKNTARAHRAYKERNNANPGHIAMAVFVLAVAFGSIAYYAASPYIRLADAPISNFTPSVNISNFTASVSLIRQLEAGRGNITVVGSGRDAVVAAVHMNSSLNGSTYVVIGKAYPYANNSIMQEFTGNSTRYSGMHALILKNGVVVHALEGISNGSLFYVNYFSLPYFTGGRYITLSYEIISNDTAAYGRCMGNDDGADYLESALYDYEAGYFGDPYKYVLCPSYLIASG